MLFNEKEMLNLCKELGVKVVSEKRFPTLGDIELTPDVIREIFEMKMERTQNDTTLQGRNIFDIRASLKTPVHKE